MDSRSPAGGENASTARTNASGSSQNGKCPLFLSTTNCDPAIEARLREHTIPAVSIAVFDHYQLPWAKAYGMAVEPGARASEKTISVHVRHRAAGIAQRLDRRGSQIPGTVIEDALELLRRCPSHGFEPDQDLRGSRRMNHKPMMAASDP